ARLECRPQPAAKKSRLKPALQLFPRMPASPDILQSLWPVLLAYIVAATPFGFLAGKLRGIDIRQHGSGNIGATNVLRVLGKPVGITVLVLDMLKGFAP